MLHYWTYDYDNDDSMEDPKCVFLSMDFLPNKMGTQGANDDGFSLIFSACAIQSHCSPVDMKFA
jgi:hypothetical protein